VALGIAALSSAVLFEFGSGIGAKKRSDSHAANRTTRAEGATARLPATPKVRVALRPPAENDRESETLSDRSRQPCAENLAGNDAAAWRSSCRFKVLRLEGEVPLHGYRGSSVYQQWRAAFHSTDR
jgi:hypothetical protein